MLIKKKKTYKPGCQQTINSDNYTVSEFTFSVYEQSLQRKGICNSITCANAHAWNNDVPLQVNFDQQMQNDPYAIMNKTMSNS